MNPRRHQVLSNATLTASGNSGPLQNLGRFLNPTVVLVVDVQGTVAGTTPSLTVSLWGSTGSNRLTQIQADSAITAQLPASPGPHRVEIPDVLEENLQVQWAVTGAGASFAGVYIDLLMTSPDA